MEYDPKTDDGRIHFTEWMEERRNERKYEKSKFDYFVRLYDFENYGFTGALAQAIVLNESNMLYKDDETNEMFVNLHHVLE